ncbi:Lectin 1 [Holothuria leucospilota]|uniref:Lectin 1 n=1 Tax=Holothuria leucospilota TaxID=206669 RepID=A0A9Q1CFX9_HOLLE|nr:Lectin 1 [Holothuria leucospilota]
MQSQTIFLLGIMLMLVGGSGGCQIPCPPLWTGFKGKCYRLFHDKLSFADAEDACQLFKLIDCNGDVLTTGHLASIHSEEEQQFLVSLVTSSLPLEIDDPSRWDPQVFIGMVVGSSNSVQYWTDGSSFDYNGWFPGEPNNGPNSGGAIAAGTHSDGFWADVYSTFRWRYICQLPCIKYRLD